MNESFQVCARGLQLAVLAVARPRDPRPEVVHAAPRANTATDVLQHVGARLMIDDHAATVLKKPSTLVLRSRERKEGRKGQLEGNSYTSRNEEETTTNSENHPSTREANSN